MPSQRRPASPLRVLIAGGGVAGVECLLGLHELAGGLVDLTLLTEGRELQYRPLAVGEPFGGEPARRYPLSDVARHTGAHLEHGVLDRVDVADHVVTTLDGTHLDYDVLVLTLGAVPDPPYGSALTFDVAKPGLLAHLRDRVRSGRTRRLVIALPPGPHWMLPGYELALLVARDAVPPDLDLTVITAEAAPLEVFGAEASAAVRREFDDAGIRLVTRAHAKLSAEDPTTVTLAPSGETLGADSVVALPQLHAPTTRGVPTTLEGFLPVDGHGRLVGALDVYAAGDCTAFELKQGGLAAQQADVVVEHLAARAGVSLSPRPLHPVLRARMLTGGEPLWLRRDLMDARDPGLVSGHALWWPPDKIAGRFLAPYVAALNDAEAGVAHAPAHGRAIDVGLASSPVPVPRELDLLGDPPSDRAR